MFWSGKTNTQPLLYGDRIEGAGYIVGQGEISVPDPFPLGIQPLAGLVGAGNDFMGTTIAADGGVWASYDQDCGPSPTSPGCVANHDQTRGFVGRLTWTAAPAPAGGAAVHARTGCSR